MPRDVVLGVEFVSGTGQLIRAGGRVVKNVAGFDLTRLVVGSWGTLGVITEVTVRLRARPQHMRSLALPISTNAEKLNEVATRLRALPFTPLASEVISAALAAELGLTPNAMLLLRVAGNANAIHGHIDALATLGPIADDIGEEVWQKLRMADSSRDDAASSRWSALPSHFGDVWNAADRSARETSGGDAGDAGDGGNGGNGGEGGDALLHGNPARGVVRVITTGRHTVEAARAASGFEGTVIFERLPSDGWRLATQRVAQDPISRAIRAKFDPAGILNPGILGDAA
jgi:glycolate oxidase FAD binding subunit